jgi:hypothetical protein
MVRTRFWLKLLELAWKELSVVWLAGGRRVGTVFIRISTKLKISTANSALAITSGRFDLIRTRINVGDSFKW